MLWFRILGPLEVERDTVAVPLPAAKHRALLLALLLRQDTVCSTDQLLDALWERPPASATKLLQAYVSHLRQVLGADAIDTVAPGYRLRVDPERVDARRFERLHDQARSALAAANPELAVALVSRALALWRGPALADVAYEAFADAEAARLEERRLQCVEVGLDAQLALGRHEQLIGELVQLSEDHPVRERLHERLALALYRSGRQADALAAVAAARDRLRDEFGLDPGRGLQELERAMLTQDPVLDVPAGGDPPKPRTVPRPASALVGRDREVADLRSLLVRDEVRLVTVSGAGGSGKTRLALEVAARAGEAFANGVVVAELASVSDPALVMPTVAHALGLTETPEQPAAEIVVEWLRPRQLLLIVDNFEHVLDAAPDIAALVAAAPLVSVLVTSRRVLHVTGEHVFPLGPLSLDDASRLFAERATARDASLRIDPADGAVREICARLDCLPLAVEIAAARTAAIDLQSMRDRLRVSIGVLGPGPRDAPARQQTLADTIQWTTDLLSDAERRALARFAVVAGGCDLTAAEAVCDSDLDVIGALVDWNLLRHVDADGSRRYAMLDTIRLHASELLDRHGARQEAEAAHRAYYLAVVDAATPAGTSRPETLAVLDPDLDNLRAVYDRAAAEGDRTTALRLATALYPYWYVRGLYREGRDRIAAALAAGTSDGTLHARALRGLAAMHFLLGDDVAAGDAARRGIEVGKSAGALDQVMACHTVLGLLAHRHGELDRAREYILASAAIAEALGRDVDVMVAENNLAEIALDAGDLAEARRRYQTAFDWHERNGSDSTFAMIGLAVVARREGRLDDADALLTAARTKATHANRPQNVLLATLWQAAVAADRHDVETAGRMLNWARTTAVAITGDLVGDELAAYRFAEAAVLAAVGPERLADLEGHPRPGGPT